MTRRRWIGLVILVALVVVTSGKIVSTAANQVPKSNAGEEKLRIHIALPAATTPLSSTAVDHGDGDKSGSDVPPDAPETTDTTDVATGDEPTAGDSSETQPERSSDSSQSSSAEGAGVPAAQGFAVSPEVAGQQAASPTAITTPTPAPTATSTPVPTATPQPPVPGNIQSAGLPPEPTPGVSWFVDGCVSTTAGDTGWEFVPSAQAGVLAAAITNGQAGAVLDCVAYVANSGAAPMTVTGIIADFDPAVFALDGGLGQTVTLQPCGVALAWGIRPDGVSESCWTVVPLTIRIGAAVGQDWIGIGVSLAPGD